MNKETILELNELTKQIDDKNIVNNLSFAVNKGEILGLLGPNGAGKTTTIRMVVGLISKTKGQVLVNGLDVENNFIDAMSQIGAIVEDPRLYQFLSGYKNLVLFSRMTRNKVTKAQIYELLNW